MYLKEKIKSFTKLNIYFALSFSITKWLYAETSARTSKQSGITRKNTKWICGKSTENLTPMAWSWAHKSLWDLDVFVFNNVNKIITLSLKYFSFMALILFSTLPKYIITFLSNSKYCNNNRLINKEYLTNSCKWFISHVRVKICQWI